VAYILQSDLVPLRLTQAELIELTDDVRSGEVNTTTLQTILDEASALVDTYCGGGRYTLPLVATTQVKAATRDIAIYRLFERRRRITPDVATGYANVMQLLADVAAGKATFDQPAAGQQQSTAMKAVTRDHSQDPDVFDPTKLTGF
jgi:phage gp36-like protein